MRAIDSGFGAQIGKAEDKEVYLLTFFHREVILRQEAAEAIGADEAVGLFVYIHVDRIVLARLHPKVLLGKGHKQVFVQPHVHPGPEGRDFLNQQVGVLIALCKRALRGSDGPVFRIGIHEHLYFPTLLQAFRHILIGQQDIIAFFIVKDHAVGRVAHGFEVLKGTNFYHDTKLGGSLTISAP